MRLRSRCDAVARLVTESRDLLEARPWDGEVPAAVASRGWTELLLSLDDAAVDAVEAAGLDAPWPAETPASLIAFARDARELCELPAFASAFASASASASASPSASRRFESPRKRAQVDAFTRLVLPLATGAGRVLDVGCGHGHLTRAIAERLARPVIGLERDVALAAKARSRAPTLTFAVTDVVEDGLALSAADCVIGLHTCGELADAIVESAARAGASLAIVGCCLQKRRAASRRSLAARTAAGEPLDLPRDLLGLSNLTARDDGVEASRAENLAARERRLALHSLLEEHVGPLRFGAEIEGLNRRAAHGDLASLVARAFARRQLPLPTPAAVADAAARARARHARVRRLSLPRALLARVLEVHVLTDRALFLEDHGFEVAIGAAFPAQASARNLALVAEHDRGA